MKHITIIKRQACGKKMARLFILAGLLIVNGVLVSAQASASSTTAASVRIRIDGIEQFRRIDAEVYSGLMPLDNGLRSLVRARVKTLVCLGRDVPYAKLAQELQLHVESIPLSTFSAPDPDAVRRFLAVVTDPAAKPVFFHAQTSENQLSVMTAIYRMQIQGWPEEAALAEMKTHGLSAIFVDLKSFVLSYRIAAQKAAAASDQHVRAAAEAGTKHLAGHEAQKAVSCFNAALQKNPDFTGARLSRALAYVQTGNKAQALADVREAMIRAASQPERVSTAQTAIQILDQSSSKGALPADGFDMADREWMVLELAGAEDFASLILLGNIFQRGLNFSRALEAYDRAETRGSKPSKNISEQIARVRSVRSYAPRSPLGKQLGLKPRINRGELAALLVQELRVDRMRAEQGPATWRPVFDQPGVKPAAKDIADTPHSADIQSVLALGIRGLELFSDQTFRPDAFVSRAEFVVVIEDVLTRATRDQALPTRLLGRTPRYADVSTGAWYQSAADLARGMGLFAPAESEVRNFKPLIEVTGLEALQAFRLLKKTLDLRSRVIVVVVDALRAESIYTGLDHGRLPNLARLINERGVVRVEKCLSALPSVTLPNHTTIFTGVYPGRHGVPGNEWFDRSLGNDEPFYRRTREYVKYGTEDDPGLGRAWSFGGIPVHDMDLAPSVRTIYEAFKEAESKRGRKAKTAVVFDPVRRGADKVVNPDVFDALITLDILPFVNQFALMDKSAMKNAVELIASDEPPELMGIWLSGLDGWSHAYGPGPAGSEADRQAKYIAENTDPLIGDLVRALEERGILGETSIFLVSDHGQADTAGDAKYAIDAEKVYQALSKSPYRPPLDKDGHLNDHAKDFGMAVMANSNGNAALISIRTPGREWKSAPTQMDIEAVSNILISQPYVSRIFFIGPAEAGREPAVYTLTAGAGGPDKSRLPQESDELLIVRTLGTSGSVRSGDLLVEARHPYYFAPAGSVYRGQHGRRESVEDHVPLLILNPSGGRKHVVASVSEIADIAPTVAGVLGFLDFLPADGKDLLDPPRIIVSSHTEDQVVPAGKDISIMGFVHDAVGIVRVEYRVGDEGSFNIARGTSTWDAAIRLSPGRRAVFIRATDETGLQSQVRFHLLAR